MRGHDVVVVLAAVLGGAFQDLRQQKPGTTRQGIAMAEPPKSFGQLDQVLASLVVCLSKGRRWRKKAPGEAKKAP